MSDLHATFVSNNLVLHRTGTCQRFNSRLLTARSLEADASRIECANAPLLPCDMASRVQCPLQQVCQSDKNGHILAKLRPTACMLGHCCLSCSAATPSKALLLQQSLLHTKSSTLRSDPLQGLQRPPVSAIVCVFGDRHRRLPCRHSRLGQHWTTRPACCWSTACCGTP